MDGYGLNQATSGAPGYDQAQLAGRDVKMAPPVGNRAQPQPIGVHTRRAQIFDAVSRLGDLSFHTSQLLGLSVPPKEEPPSDGTLAGDLGIIAARLAAIYDLFHECAEHIGG